MKKRWTEAEKSTLARVYPGMPFPEIVALLGRTPSSIRNQVNQQGLRRSQGFLDSSNSGRIKASFVAAHRFKPGHATWNKGKPHPTTGRAAQTQFKAGNKPQTWREIGAERTTREGWVERKVSDTGDRNKDWQRADVLDWVAANGPIPDGHKLTVIETSKPRTLDNLKPMTRAEIMKRNSYHTNYPPEVARLMQLKGAINRQIRRIAKEST